MIGRLAPGVVVRGVPILHVGSEHVEYIVTSPTGKQVNVYLHLSNAYFINFINDMRLCLQEEVYLCTQEGDKIVVGLTQP